MFTRGLTRWLKLPGLARSASPVWVTPRGVKPDIIAIQRATPRLGYFLVHDWVARAELFEAVEAIFVSVGGELVAHPVTVGDRTDPVIRAFLDERLWLWQIPVLAVDAPAVFPPLPGEPEAPGRAPQGALTWIEITLVDETGEPVSNERFLLVLPDGSQRNGRLDDKGFARVEQIPAGVCDVSFPDIDGREWGRK